MFVINRSLCKVSDSTVESIWPCSYAKRFRLRAIWPRVFQNICIVIQQRNASHVGEPYGITRLCHGFSFGISALSVWAWKAIRLYSHESPKIHTNAFPISIRRRRHVARANLLRGATSKTIVDASRTYTFARRYFQWQLQFEEITRYSIFIRGRVTHFRHAYVHGGDISDMNYTYGEREFNLFAKHSRSGSNICMWSRVSRSKTQSKNILPHVYFITCIFILKYSNKLLRIKKHFIC